jgi:hypothetical protein
VRTITHACLVAILLLPACHRETPEESAAQDARDIAFVEASQKVHPPVQRLDLEPVSGAVRKIFNLSPAGCDFRPEGHAGADAVLIAGRFKAVLRIHDDPMVLAADSGSAQLAPSAYGKYVGRTHWAELSRAPDMLTIRDRWDRIVYSAQGTLDCHA